MAEPFRFELVSPERSLASLEAEVVDLPGVEGDMAAMRDHAALITTLKPGLVKVKSDRGTTEFFVSGGFVDIAAERTIVLAEHAYPRHEVTSQIAEELAAKMEAEIEASEGSRRDIAETRMAGFRSIRAELDI